MRFGGAWDREAQAKIPKRDDRRSLSKRNGRDQKSVRSKRYPRRRQHLRSEISVVFPAIAIDECRKWVTIVSPYDNFSRQTYRTIRYRLDARRGRDGRGLSCTRHAAGPKRRAQAARRRIHEKPGPDEPLRTGSEDRLRTESSQHHYHSR